MRRPACLMVLMFGLSGCLELATTPPGSVRIHSMAPLVGGQTQVNMEVELGHALYAALQSGVPIELEWQLQVVEQGWLSKRPQWHRDGRRQLGFLSLRNNFTLDDGFGQQRYPNQATLERALARLVLTEVPSLRSDQQYRFRIRLAANALPPPMRLPARINPIWWFDSDWQQIAESNPQGV